MSASLLIGLNIASLLLAGIVLFEYARVHRAERALLAALGHAPSFPVVPLLLACAYLGAAMALAGVTAWIFASIPVA